MNNDSLKPLLEVLSCSLDLLVYLDGFGEEPDLTVYEKTSYSYCYALQAKNFK